MVSREAQEAMREITLWDVETFKLRGVSYRIETSLGPVVWLVPHRPKEPTPRIEMTPDDLFQLDPQTVLDRILHLHHALELFGGRLIERLP